MNDIPQQRDLNEPAVALVSAFVGNSTLRINDLPALIALTHTASSGLTIVEPLPAPIAEHQSAVTAQKSLANRGVFQLAGRWKPYKSLKRYLSSQDLTPDEYRVCCSLAASNPMVAWPAGRRALRPPSASALDADRALLIG